jgi:hypothetical protein
MIEQENTIDYDELEFTADFHDSIQPHIRWSVKVCNMRKSFRPYWWECVIVSDIDQTPVVQHFFAATYEQLQGQIINFLATYYKY